MRRLVGYGRYESEAALAPLHRVYDELRPWTNLWQPTLKLIAKLRDDATGKTRKTYDEAQTPYQRVLAAGAGTAEARATLAETFAAAGPHERRRRLVVALEVLQRLQERSNELFKLANAG